MHKGDSIAGFITGPSVGVWFMHSLMTLFKQDKDGRFLASWLMSMGPYIHDNRNELQREFLKLEDRDWLFMVDNDMVFQHTDVWALLDAAEERGPGIYSAPYLMENGVFVCGTWGEGEHERAYRQLVKLPTEEPFQTGVVGGGFTLVHREVFDAVGPNAFSATEISQGEDLAFCWRAKEAGITPWVVPASKPGHTKTVVIYPERITNMVHEDVELARQEKIEI